MMKKNMKKILDFKNYRPEVIVIGLVAVLTLVYFAVRAPAYTGITNCTELQAMNTNLAGSYQLANDIDCSDTVNWNAGAGFVPIGDINVTAFSGNFNGNGKKITGLFINRPSAETVGLFGYISGATITNVGVEDINISGFDYVGGLVGRVVNSSVLNSYSTGVVNSDTYAGGLVGYNFVGGTISNSYSKANTNGTNYSGGLVAYNNVGTISNSYSTGSVASTGTKGGLVGGNGGTTTASFWNTETSGQAVGCGTGDCTGATGVTTAQLIDPATFISAGWNFTTVWDVNSFTNGGLPFFRTSVISGSGTSSDPFIVTTCVQLQDMKDNLSAYYKLDNDIDCSMTNVGAGFAPVGNDSTPFIGNFNGNGKKITGLYINRPIPGSGEEIALFGFIGSGATIANVGMEAVDIHGNNYVSSLVGLNNHGTISNSYSTGNVNGNEVGGLVGDNRGTITNSYSTVNVTGVAYVAGFVGYNVSSGTISNSYSTGSVTGTNNVGGFTGQNSGTTTNSFWATDTSGQATGCGTGSCTGVTGVTAAGLKTQSTFTAAGWDFTTIWDINGSTNNGFPFLRAPLPPDTIAPTGSIIINSNAPSTISTSATLNLSVTDAVGVTDYLVSENSTTPTVSDARWVAVTSTTSYYSNVAYTFSNNTNEIKTVYIWYKDAAGNVSATSSDTIILDTAPNIIATAGGAHHSLFLKNDGTVWASGANGSGQLGNGTNANSLVPVKVSSLIGITTIAAGGSNSLALKNDGTVWAWGNDGVGQLGNGGTNTNSNVPVQVSGLTGITAIAVGGHFHSLALKNDGTVWAWGRNQYGQLGNGTTTNSNVPIQVSSLTSITAIAAGYDHSLALKNDGTVQAWGNGEEGQLGNGTNTSSNVPVQVSSLTSITAIAGEEQDSLALKNDGTAWDWGYGHDGQLGNGANINSNVPVQVSSLTSITAIAGGAFHSLALKNDSTVQAWGDNTMGELGDGTTTSSNVPVSVSSLTSITAVAGGEQYSLALKNDGTVQAWGFNDSGQLGNGTTTNSSIPVLVLTVPVPDTTITSSPTDPSTSSSASFTFTSTEANSTFECKLDSGSFTSCSTPQDYTGLFAGSHTFSVRAIDQALNTDPTPASFTWVINLSVDTDGDGVLDNVDQCPTVKGTVYKGCPFADITNVTSHIIDQQKYGVCGTDSKGKPKPECDQTLSDVSVKVFDRENASFKSTFTQRPEKSVLDSIFNSDIGLVSSCTTDVNGTCTAGEDHAGKFLVVAKWVDGSNTIYTGKHKNFKKKNIKTSEDDDDDVDVTTNKFNTISKNLRFIKTINKNGSVNYSGGTMLVIAGSELDVIYPEYTIWDGTAQSYPFIMTSDDTWTTDVCMSVPAGYKITGVTDQDGNIMKTSDCVQSFIAGETKVILFTVTDIGSPEPKLDVGFTTTHKGKKVKQNLTTDGIRKATKEKQDKDLKVKIDKVKGKKGNQVSMASTEVTIWNEVAARLADSFADQIRQAVMQIAKKNDIAIPEWGVNGHVDARTLGASVINSFFR